MGSFLAVCAYLLEAPSHHPTQVCPSLCFPATLSAGRWKGPRWANSALRSPTAAGSEAWRLRSRGGPPMLCATCVLKCERLPVPRGGGRAVS